MSLVSPRPFPDYHLSQFSPVFLELRQRVRPGITGLWQTTIRSDGGIAERVAYDSHYTRTGRVAGSAAGASSAPDRQVQNAALQRCNGRASD